MYLQAKILEDLLSGTKYFRYFRMSANINSSNGSDPFSDFLTKDFELLQGLTCVAVQPYVERTKLVTEFEQTNKFLIFDPATKAQIFYAEDVTNYCLKTFCANSIRWFELRICNREDEEFLHLSKFTRCTFCCFPCCHQEMIILSPPGTVLGKVKQFWSPFTVNLLVRDSAGEKRFRIKGRPSFFNNFKDMVINVYPQRKQVTTTEQSETIFNQYF